MNILELLSWHGVGFALSSVIMAFMLLNASGMRSWSTLNGQENSPYDMRLNVIPGRLDVHIAVIDMDDYAYKNSVGHGAAINGPIIGI